MSQQYSRTALRPVLCLALILISLLMQGCAEQPASSARVSQKPIDGQVIAVAPKHMPAKYISGPPPPAWLKKFDPATATAQSKLDSKYTVAGREALFHKLQVRQASVSALVHLKFMQMPPAAPGQESEDRFEEEADKKLKATNQEYDKLRHEERLTTEEMDQLFQEANDNNWQ